MKYIVTLIILMILTCCSEPVYANNPGGHMVQLTWTDPSCVAPSCTFNVYRSLTAGSCGIGKTPFASNIQTTAYEDDTVVAGTSYFYSITAFPAVGGESNCSTELQLSVSSTQATATSVPQGQTH